MSHDYVYRPERYLRRLCIAALILVSLLASPFSIRSLSASEKTAQEEAGDEKRTPQPPTHKQARVIRPTDDSGLPVSLNTFCLDGSGNILACVSHQSGLLPIFGGQKDGVETANSKKIVAGLLQVYLPDGMLQRSTELPFRPTAVNLASDGSVYVAGDGKLAHLNSEGKLLSTADSPHIGDLESFEKRAADGARKQIEEFTASFREQVFRIDERIQKIKAMPEAEMTDRLKKRLATMEQQRTLYEEQLKSNELMFREAFSGQQMLAQKKGITALAVTERDVFLCCNAIEGHGYEVWRTNREFSEPVKVVDSLSGCCGQCDIQATDEHLVLAENTKFQVALLDRDGKRLHSFGSGDRSGSEGFGSCCNPMNVRCCDNGDVLTAESSIGTIKRFSKDGELLGIVGKARIGGGCKHVAIGFDEKRDRYYMMNVSKSHICVLVANSEFSGPTPEEVLARDARDGLGKKLIGEWSLTGKHNKAAESNGAVTSILQTLLGSTTEGTADTGSDPTLTSSFVFHADGKLSMVGGQLADQPENSWEPVRQEGSTLVISQLSGGIQYYDYRIEFISDDEARISMTYDEQVMNTHRYMRVRLDAIESAVTETVDQAERASSGDENEIATPESTGATE